MPRRFAPAAFAAVVLLGVQAGAAHAADASAPAPDAKTAQTQSAAKPIRPATAKKASPIERADAERLAPIDRAAFWAREAALDPADAVAGVKFAQALRQLGQTDEAVLACQKVLVLAPNNVEVLLELARDHIARNESFYALAPLKQAAQLAPKDWRAPSLLGVAYDQLARPADARTAWNAALKLSPDNPAVLSNLALSLAAGGDAAQAETLLRKAVASRAATVQTRQNLALVLGLEGKTQEAEALIRDDVPPAQAEADLAWLKGAPPPPGAASAPVAPAKSETRTWSSVANPSAEK
jgi:Flp pilus assembly protein TadD